MPETVPVDMQGVLSLLAVELTLMHPAPENYTAEMMEHRRLDEVHPCLVCGAQARTAMVADTEAGPRWLDLCWLDYDRVKRLSE